MNGNLKACICYISLYQEPKKSKNNANISQYTALLTFSFVLCSANHYLLDKTNRLIRSALVATILSDIYFGYIRTLLECRHRLITKFKHLRLNFLGNKLFTEKAIMSQEKSRWISKRTSKFNVSTLHVQC